MKINAHNAHIFVKHLTNLEQLSSKENPHGYDMYLRLRSIEKEATRLTTAECNGETTEQASERKRASIENRIKEVFGGKLPTGFFINGDPRGYALKIKELHTKPDFYKDFGGYGILAPEF